MHVLGICENVDRFFLLFPLFVDLASGLIVHSLPKVHATGSTMRLASRITEMTLLQALTTIALSGQRTRLQCGAQFLLLLAGGGVDSMNLLPEQDERFQVLFICDSAQQKATLCKMCMSWLSPCETTSCSGQLLCYHCLWQHGSSDAVTFQGDPKDRDLGSPQTFVVNDEFYAR